MTDRILLSPGRSTGQFNDMDGRKVKLPWRFVGKDKNGIDVLFICYNTSTVDGYDVPEHRVITATRVVNGKIIDELARMYKECFTVSRDIILPGE